MTGKPLARNHEQSVINALKMIEAHKDRPCPSRKEIMEWTGVARRHVWRFLAELVERGLIHVEVLNAATMRRRRLRLTGGQWTGWTARPGISSERAHSKALASRRQGRLL